MKLFGYTKAAHDNGSESPEEMAEVTIVADVQELKMIASFISKAAQRMEKAGEAFCHEHLSDANPFLSGAPDLIVCKK